MLSYPVQGSKTYGFPIPMDDTGRTAIKVHESDHHGSHGCPSMRDSDQWKELLKLMAEFDKCCGKKAKEETERRKIPVSITYGSDITPEFIYKPGKEPKS